MSIRIFPRRARGSRCVVLATVCVLAGPGAPGAWGQWEEIQKLNAEDGTTGDRFGVSVSVGGGVAIVGAWADDDAGSSSGSAYLFDVATGQQLHKLTAKDGAGNDLFGFSVGTDGNIAIVGVHLDDDAGLSSNARRRR